MEKFTGRGSMNDQFKQFERSAKKQHPEAKWLLEQIVGVKMNRKALEEAFERTGEPLGFFIAGKLTGLFILIDSSRNRMTLH
jgi:hypothetical protein